MSYFSVISQNRPDAEIEAAISAAKARAPTEFVNQGFEGEYPEVGYGIAPLRPYHLYATGTFSATWGNSQMWQASFSATNTFDAWVSITQTELAYVIITGNWNYEAVPKEVELYLKADGRDYPTINIEEMFSFETAAIFWKKPVVIQPDKVWEYRHKGINTGTEREGIRGYILATRAYLIGR